LYFDTFGEFSKAQASKINADPDTLSTKKELAREEISMQANKAKKLALHNSRKERACQAAPITNPNKVEIPIAPSSTPNHK
jgi:hypothetical protein